jgi:hypothetical protein
MGPFSDGGVIMDESPTGCWTNHHSFIEYKGQWYLFYHHNDYSPDFDKNRSARIDRVQFNPDGSIQKVIPTLRGVGITNAVREIHIDRHTGISGEGVSITFLNPSNKFEGWKTILSKDKAWVRYNDVDFGQGNLKKAKARVYSALGGTLLIRAGKSDAAPVIAKVAVPASGRWSVIDGALSGTPKGVQDVFVSLEGGNPVHVDWISFE